MNENLTWNGDTTFEVSEDVATSSDVMFRYLAVILDQRGTSELGKIDRYDSVIHLVDEIITVREEAAGGWRCGCHTSKLILREVAQ